MRASWWRWLPAALLLAAALLLHQLANTPLNALQAALFDRYQRFSPRPQHPDQPVLIVGIDSQSLAQYGQWPWPRDLLAQLVQKIQAGAPLAIGLDMLFAERDQNAPELLQRRLAANDAALSANFVSALAALPDPDQKLAASFTGAPTILASVGLSRPLPGAHPPIHPLPQLTLSPEQQQSLPHFPSALSSLAQLQSKASGEGFINAGPGEAEDFDQRSILRRVPSLAFIADQPYLSLPLEMVRQALGGGAVALESGGEGVRAIRLGDYRLPTQANGEILLHFSPPSADHHLSAADVLSGVYPPETFHQRLILIAFNSVGLQDRIITPLGDSLPGSDVHAQVIESLLSNHALQRPAWLPWLEMALLLLLGGGLSSALPRLKPRYAVASFAATGVLLLTAGYAAFSAGGWLFDGASLFLLMSPAVIVQLGNVLIRADRARRENARQLQKSREDAARLNGELDAARHIQMGLLPDPATRFPGERRFTLAALLEPARAVGGDYYDFFMLDAQHLCLAVADVSGKGVPASLFMSMAKTLGATLLRRHKDLAAGVHDLEIELSRENPAYLFVTAFIGVLDLTQGRFEYVCAGHDAPLLRRAGPTGPTVSPLPIAAISGPPLCALGDFAYASATLQLQAGDLLCFYTDGVSEAGSGTHSEMYGNQRLTESFADLPALPLQERCALMHERVRAYEAGAAPADDLTLVLLEWHGTNT
ncbi:CHASE2 domain-containing protein [Azonexus sp.]|uniref:CHASE2 domain-containing protein n=1 Tax=Azonexus sp. TaxID=1872668 RepID=UPI0039E4F014